MPHCQKDVSDEALVRLALEGNREAVEALVSRYENRLLGYIYHRVGQRETAEDLVQETFIRAFRHLESFDKQFNFSTWIYTIAKRITISHYRRRAAKPVEYREQVEAVDRRSPDRQVALTDLARRAWELAETHLPERQREALTLRFREELPIAEIAEVMGVSLANAKVLLHRGRRALAEAMRGSQPGTALEGAPL